MRDRLRLSAFRHSFPPPYSCRPYFLRRTGLGGIDEVATSTSSANIHVTEVVRYRTMCSSVHDSFQIVIPARLTFPLPAAR